MRRYSAWPRQHPFAVDCLLAAALFVLEVTVAAGLENPVVYVASAAAVCTPVAWRRAYPVVAAWSVLLLGQVATAVVWALDQTRTLPPGQLGFVIMLYTLVVYAGRRVALAYAVALLVDIVVVRLVLGTDIVTMVFFALLYAFAWITAEFLGARRAYVREVSARLAVAEADRDRRAIEAVSAERTRIARELHDVVAHAVSVMIVQADGASYALRTDPDAAEAAVRTIAATGRGALTELRRTVSLLRTDEASATHPEHGTAALARIVDMMRSAGLPVSIEQTGELDDLPPAVSLGVHRLVQESLTNVLRHGGERPRAMVAVRRERAAVTVSVVNSTDGNSPLVDVHTDKLGRGPASAHLSGSGFGVIGMRERVAVLGGQLHAGPLPNGRWRVAATLPVEPLPVEPLPVEPRDNPEPREK